MGPDWAPCGLAHFKILLNQPKYDINWAEYHKIERVFAYAFRN